MQLMLFCHRLVLSMARLYPVFAVLFLITTADCRSYEEADEGSGDDGDVNIGGIVEQISALVTHHEKAAICIANSYLSKHHKNISGSILNGSRDGGMWEEDSKTSSLSFLAEWCHPGGTITHMIDSFLKTKLMRSTVSGFFNKFLTDFTSMQCKEIKSYVTSQNAWYRMLPEECFLMVADNEELVNMFIDEVRIAKDTPNGKRAIACIKQHCSDEQPADGVKELKRRKRGWFGNIGSSVNRIFGGWNKKKPVVKPKPKPTTTTTTEEPTEPPTTTIAVHQHLPEDPLESSYFVQELDLVCPGFYKYIRECPSRHAEHHIARRSIFGSDWLGDIKETIGGVEELIDDVGVEVTDIETDVTEMVEQVEVDMEESQFADLPSLDADEVKYFRDEHEIEDDCSIKETVSQPDHDVTQATQRFASQFNNTWAKFTSPMINMMCSMSTEAIEAFLKPDSEGRKMIMKMMNGSILTFHKELPDLRCTQGMLHGYAVAQTRFLEHFLCGLECAERMSKTQANLKLLEEFVAMLLETYEKQAELIESEEYRNEDCQICNDQYNKQAKQLDIELIEMVASQFKFGECKKTKIIRSVVCSRLQPILNAKYKAKKLLQSKLEQCEPWLADELRTISKNDDGAICDVPSALDIDERRNHGDTEATAKKLKKKAKLDKVKLEKPVPVESTSLTPITEDDACDEWMEEYGQCLVDEFDDSDVHKVLKDCRKKSTQMHSIEDEDQFIDAAVRNCTRMQTDSDCMCNGVKEMSEEKLDQVFKKALRKGKRKNKRFMDKSSRKKAMTTGRGFGKMVKSFVAKSKSFTGQLNSEDINHQCVWDVKVRKFKKAFSVCETKYNKGSCAKEYKTFTKGVCKQSKKYINGKGMLFLHGKADASMLKYKGLLKQCLAPTMMVRCVMGMKNRVGKVKKGCKKNKPKWRRQCASTEGEAMMRLVHRADDLYCEGSKDAVIWKDYLEVMCGGELDEN